MAFKSALAIAAVLASLATSAGAQTYPDHPIRFVVPTGPGGASDVVARIVGEKIQASLRQPVVVENRAGANGNVGAAYVLSQPADGYTLMLGHIGLMTINAHLYKDMTFRPLAEFVPVIRTTSYPNLLVVNNKLPIGSTKELIEYARSSTNPLTYSSAGVGGSFHMGFELLKAEAGIKAQHVPYTGTAKALMSVVSGETDATFTDVISSSSQINSNMVRGLAISSKRRSPVMPNLPTVSESGIPGLVDFDVTGWNGIVVKAGTPPDRIRLLSEHIKRALDEPDVVERIAKLGAEVAPSTSEDFGAFMRAEDKKWGELVKKADLKID
jgi:tripartite-type tricarboxylate transporter receptor subunit TctC